MQVGIDTVEIKRIETLIENKERFFRGSIDPDLVKDKSKITKVLPIVTIEQISSSEGMI